VVAGVEHAAPGDSTVTAQVGIGPDGDAFGLIVTLVIHVPGMERDKVREFAEPPTRSPPVLSRDPRQ
jgi:hypothetical protein